MQRARRTGRLPNKGAISEQQCLAPDESGKSGILLFNPWPDSFGQLTDTRVCRREGVDDARIAFVRSGDYCLIDPRHDDHWEEICITNEPEEEKASIDSVINAHPNPNPSLSGPQPDPTGPENKPSKPTTHASPVKAQPTTVAIGQPKQNGQSTITGLGGSGGSAPSGGNLLAPGGTPAQEIGFNVPPPASASAAPYVPHLSAEPGPGVKIQAALSGRPNLVVPTALAPKPKPKPAASPVPSRTEPAPALEAARPAVRASNTARAPSTYGDARPSAPSMSVNDAVNVMNGVAGILGGAAAIAGAARGGGVYIPPAITAPRIPTPASAPTYTYRPQSPSGGSSTITGN